MATAKAPPNKFAVEMAEKEFRRLHPELKGRALGTGVEDGDLRAEWVRLYQKYNGEVLPRKEGNGAKSVQCRDIPRHTPTVYVYIPHLKPDDWHGHVGMVVQQKDGSYIRYSQSAVNPNLQGADRVQYLVWWQQSKIERRRFSAGISPRAFGGRGTTKVIRIPTRHPEQIQAAVSEYEKDKPQYHLITNNCADFVNDCLNEADDVSVWDATLPLTYYQKLVRQYPDCVVR